jgi:hypothetical protein
MKLCLYFDAKIPLRVGPEHIDQLTHNTNGIWYPSSNLVMASNNDKYGLINPFATINSSWRMLSNTDSLGAQDARLQWAMPMVDSPSRDNWGIAYQDMRHAEARADDKPAAAVETLPMSKGAFLTFASLRANPMQQLRKLCIAIKDRELPLGHAAVRGITQQLLYQTGEIVAGEKKGPLRLLWQSDLMDKTFVQVS